jgi:Mg/Co/Ni transporter MgtE
MELDEAVDALRDLDTDEREQILASMAPRPLGALRSLLAYDEDTAGGIMTSDLITIPIDASVGRAISEITAARNRPDQVGFVVIIDPDGRAVGEISAAQLLGVHNDLPVAQVISTPPATIPVDAGMDEVVEGIVDHRGTGLLVIDDLGLPLGRILADDLIDVLAREHDRRWPWQREIGS